MNEKLKQEVEAAAEKYEQLNEDFCASTIDFKSGAQFMYDYLLKNGYKFEEHDKLDDINIKLNEEIKELKAKLQITNSNWPHEKDLHDKIKELEKKLEITAIGLKNIQHRADNFDSYITIENICIEALKEIEGVK